MIRCICSAVVLGLLPALSAQKEEDKVLRRPFGVFDRNKDGFVTAKEFPGEKDLFKAMDKNRDKRITFEEYKVSELAKRYLIAQRVNRGEPRKRTNRIELASRRLALIGRFDANRDGKVTRREWIGSPTAFLSLDVDGNGVLDKRDRKKARAESDALAVSLVTRPKTRNRLPGTKEMLKKHDRDGDSQLSRKEAKRSPLLRYFDYADKSGDDSLDTREIQNLVEEVNAIVNKKNLGSARPVAPTIPFSVWDKNKDGRVDLKEWVEKKYLFKQMDLNRDAAVTEREVLRFKRMFEGRDFLEKFDLDGNKSVTREEFGGSAAAFRRADRNGDGVISARDR